MDASTPDMFDTPIFKGGGFFRATVQKYGLDWELFESLFNRLDQSAITVQDIRLTNLNRKWEIVSSVQKSIRRGEVDHALRGASALINTKDLEMIRYLWKRVCTTAAEDIGLANPLLVAFTLLCAETFTPAKFANVQKAVIYFLITELSASLKDRTLCDMAIIDACWVKSKNKGSISAQIHGVGEQLYLAKAVEECSLYLPTNPLFKYLSGQVWRTEEMGKFYPVGESMRQDEFQRIKVLRTGFAIYEALPSYAYDMHTQLGKKAISLAIRSEPLKEFFSTVQVEDPVRAYGWALFYNEGGNLNEQLEYAWRDDLYQTAINISLISMGIPLEKVMQLIALVRESLPVLEGLRKKIAGVTYAK